MLFMLNLLFIFMNFFKMVVRGVFIFSLMSVILIVIIFWLGLNFTLETDILFLTTMFMCVSFVLLVCKFILFLRLVGIVNFTYKFILIPFNSFSESYFKAVNNCFFYYSWLQKYPKAWRIFTVLIYNLLIIGFLVVVTYVLPHKCVIYIFYYLYYIYSWLLLGNTDMTIVNTIFF